MFERISFEFGHRKASNEGVPSRTLTVAVLGDFSGHPEGDLEERPLYRIDIDRFDTVLDRIAPSVELGDERVEFHALDDFHPDSLFRRLHCVRELRDRRERLTDPASFEEAARQLESPAEESGPEPAAGSLFDQLIGKPASSNSMVVRSTTKAIDALIAGLVEPHLGRSVDAERQALLIATVDQAIAEIIRRVLHHPSVRALESAWRALYWMINRATAEDAIRICLLDVSRAELLADIATADQAIEDTVLGRRFIDRDELAMDDHGTCLVVGNYGFCNGKSDLALLDHLGRLAARLGGVFLGAAEPGLLGLDQTEWPEEPAIYRRLPESPAAWTAFRKTTAARHVGLALPGFILRLPYGPSSDPTENFRFEEIPATPRRSDCLWGNAAWLCAGLIAESFDPETGPGETTGQVDDLPCPVYSAGDGRALQPGTEMLLSDFAAAALLARGLMPLLGSNRHNSVQLARLQSVAEPASGLP